MKYKILSLGGTTEKEYAALCEEYYKRLRGNGCFLETVDLKPEALPGEPSPAQIQAALEREGDRLLQRIPKQSYIIALCVEGRELSSPELASAMEKAALAGYGCITCIIGSSYGLSERVKQAAHLRLSLSRLTLPHKLARLVLAEALYRSEEILRGSRYHK